MTRDEIIKMAREAGGLDFISHGAASWVGTQSQEFLERFARAAYAAGAASEREACASDVRFADNGTEAAEIIRARGQK